LVGGQVKDVQLEMEEMHDQFREEETAEMRELQRELETTAKACRIVNFKLRKTERHRDQLQAEKFSYYCYYYYCYFFKPPVA